MQGVIEMQSLILLGFRQLCDRNVGPAGNNLCDLILGDCLVHEREVLPLHLRLLGCELFLQLGELAVLKLCGLVQVIGLLRRLNFVVRVLNLLPDLGELRDTCLLILPLCLGLGKRCLLLGELFLDGLESLLREVVGLLPERRRLDFELHAAAVHLVEFRRQRVELGLNHRAGFIDQVDGLVGQEAVGDIAVREHRRADQRAVLNLHMVVVLVALLQAAEYGNRIFDGRLIHENRLETPLECRILFNVLSVLVKGRRADAVELAARKHGL